MKPPAPVSGEISVEIARMPVGRIAAMKPEPFGLDQLLLADRLAGDERRARDRAGDLLDRVGLLGAADEVGLAAAAGQAAIADRPGLTDLAEPDVDLGDQDIDGLDLGDRLRGRRLFADPPARNAAMPPAARATTRTTRRAAFIRFTFHIDAARLPSPLVEFTS